MKKQSFLTSVAAMSVRKLYVAVLVCATSITAPAAEAIPILHEAGGNFSNKWVSPTVVASGTTGVTGTGAPEWMGGDRLDIFKFSGLVPGATSIVFDFSLTGPYSPGAYENGGGAIYYSYAPFSGSYYVDQGDGKVRGSQDLLAGYFDVTYNPWNAANASNRGTSSFTLNLAKEFAGDLFLALDFTYGRVSYNINSPSWATYGDTDPSSLAVPVPLPATGWLLLAGLVGLAANRRKLI
ncbi:MULTISPECIES: VPLPA-CTERM sorting domain-containing protein [unclassified Nitrosospira]|uniref:VPLPA-CTERM sorting domain-containing protein n=1 Tax=unclassified Nitrosospira TaxID=2609267 RepID=UPI000D307AE0|nr:MULTISPECIES: VPLPA-CTERM sorting domain-containing protein [unclassified Nitrosospira]PTR17634.1 putative secreted protein [Nitrosospira sp. Nsp2]WON74060.1 VPLPA-CTERM sorting domain-containing protein [Nitrosospira sp. Is2]